MMRETGRGKEDVGRMRLKVKGDATKSGTNGGLGNKELGQKGEKTHLKQACEPGSRWPELRDLPVEGA